MMSITKDCLQCDFGFEISFNSFFFIRLLNISDAIFLRHCSVSIVHKVQIHCRIFPEFPFPSLHLLPVNCVSSLLFILFSLIFFSPGIQCLVRFVGFLSLRFARVHVFLFAYFILYNFNGANGIWNCVEINRE